LLFISILLSANVRNISQTAKKNEEKKRRNVVALRLLCSGSALWQNSNLRDGHAVALDDEGGVTPSVSNLAVDTLHHVSSEDGLYLALALSPVGEVSIGDGVTPVGIVELNLTRGGRIFVEDELRDALLQIQGLQT
jgi:hypothetical protein